MNVRALGIATLAALLLAGCGGDTDDLNAYIAEVRSRTSKVIEPIPQIKSFDAFSYDPGERREPFEPMLAVRDTVNAGGGGIRPDFNRNKEPLEEYSLDGLRMVGTIRVKERGYALVKAPDNVIHRVTTGDHLGQNYGKVTRVAESEIELMEIIPDGFGGWMQRPASLALAE